MGSGMRLSSCFFVACVNNIANYEISIGRFR